MLGAGRDISSPPMITGIRYSIISKWAEKNRYLVYHLLPTWPPAPRSMRC